MTIPQGAINLTRYQQTPEVVLIMLNLLQSQMSQMSNLISLQAQTSFSPPQLQQQLFVMQDTLRNITAKLHEPHPSSTLSSNPLNPYSVPNLLWKTTSESSGTIPKSTSVFSPQKSLSSDTSISTSTRSSGTESSDDGSISESSEESAPLGSMVNNSAGVAYQGAASSSLDSQDESSEEENVPLARQSMIRPISLQRDSTDKLIPNPLVSVQPLSNNPSSQPHATKLAVGAESSDEGSQSEESDS